MTAPPPGPDPFVDLADEATVRAAAEARSAARWRRERASDVATWLGTLRDLAERQAGVVVGAASGRTHHGVLAGVAVDHLLLQVPGGSVVVVRDAVRFVAVDPDAPAPPAMGDREAPHDRRLVDVLAAQLETGDDVTIGVVGDVDDLHGVVVGLGEDVVTLRLRGAARRTVYLPVDAVVEVLLRA